MAVYLTIAKLSPSSSFNWTEVALIITVPIFQPNQIRPNPTQPKSIKKDWFGLVQFCQTMPLQTKQIKSTH